MQADVFLAPQISAGVQRFNIDMVISQFVANLHLETGAYGFIKCIVVISNEFYGPVPETLFSYIPNTFLSSIHLCDQDIVYIFFFF